MKLAAFSIVYNEERLIQGCINTWKGIVDKHIILVSVKPFHGKAVEADGTLRICRNNNIATLQRDWRSEHEMRNAAITLLRDYDYILINDADMWLTKEDAYKLINEIGAKNKDAYIIPQRAYWFDIDHSLIGDDFKPVIAIKPYVWFTHIGNVNKPCEVIQTAICHHLNWCKPKDILKKVQTYSHANEMTDVELWYKNHFLTWKEGEKAIMPVQNGRSTSFDVARTLLPTELREWLDE